MTLTDNSVKIFYFKDFTPIFIFKDGRTVGFSPYLEKGVVDGLHFVLINSPDKELETIVVHRPYFDEAEGIWSANLSQQEVFQYWEACRAYLFGAINPYNQSRINQGVNVRVKDKGVAITSPSSINLKGVSVRVDDRRVSIISQGSIFSTPSEHSEENPVLLCSAYRLVTDCFRDARGMLHEGSEAVIQNRHAGYIPL